MSPAAVGVRGVAGKARRLERTMQPSRWAQTLQAHVPPKSFIFVCGNLWRDPSAWPIYQAGATRRTFGFRTPAKRRPPWWTRAVKGSELDGGSAPTMVPMLHLGFGFLLG
jgi:hypothetical protein